MKVINYKLLHRLGTFDNAKRWYPLKFIAPYFNGYRAPSRAFPYSYSNAAHTKKFKKYLFDNFPEIYSDIF